MNKYIFNKTFLLLFVFSLLEVLVVEGQNNYAGNAGQANQDSLTLKQVISRMIGSHPTIAQAAEAINAANAKIGLARTGYYPNVDATASYTRIGPVPQFDFPSFGVIKLFPENNYVATLNFDQTLYDFGKLSKEVALENQNKVLAEETLEQVKQRMSLAATGCFYTLAYLQEAIRIKDEQLTTLNAHLEFLRKKNLTGSATQYELLTTQVKISGVESQKLDLESAWKIQLSVLNSLMGLPDNEVHVVKQELNAHFPLMAEDSLRTFALEHRDEMKIALQKEALASMRLDMARAQNNPVINVFANAGGKNGYVPDINKVKANFAAGLGIRVPVFDATRSKNTILQAQSMIRSNNLETEVTRRNISNEVVENLANLVSARKKVDQFELQEKQAAQALGLAQTSYRNGIITNLDLLDATTSVSESRLMLLKSRIDYNLDYDKLKVALGLRLY